MSEKQKEDFLALVAEYSDVEAEEITMDMRFREDLGFNSLNFMTFLGDLEDVFDIEIDADEVLNLSTVGDALKNAEELVQG
ncbi:MAG: acyl carrier protein [Lachnospiraceae bacterium]|nr:acyl carrier protein [Lachnospiraceae bacterium]